MVLSVVKIELMHQLLEPVTSCRTQSSMMKVSLSGPEPSGRKSSSAARSAVGPEPREAIASATFTERYFGRQAMVARDTPHLVQKVDRFNAIQNVTVDIPIPTLSLDEVSRSSPRAPEHQTNPLAAEVPTL